jgi:hypothetical protein
MSVGTELEYIEMLERLLGRIGNELGVKVNRYDFGKFQNNEYSSGDFTYNYDSAFQVKLCRWLGWANHVCEEVPSPTPIVEVEEEAKFEVKLKEALKKLLQKESPGDA